MLNSRMIRDIGLSDACSEQLLRERSRELGRWGGYDVHVLRTS